MKRPKLTYLFYIIAISFILFGIMYMFNGSLEAFATEEQTKKTRIVGAFMLILGVICGIVSYTGDKNSKE